jgi:zinc protease
MKRGAGDRCWVLGVRCAVFGLVLCLMGSAIGRAASVPAADPKTEDRTPKPDVLKAIVPNGLRLLAKPNPSSDIVALDCLVRVGLRDEPEESAGIAALLGETIIRGTEKHPPAKMAAVVGAVGGSLEVTPGFDFTELWLTTTRDRFPQALQLLADVLGTATLEPGAIDAARTALKGRMAAQADDLTASSYQELLLQI